MLDSKMLAAEVIVLLENIGDQRELTLVETRILGLCRVCLPEQPEVPGSDWFRRL